MKNMMKMLLGLSTLIIGGAKLDAAITALIPGETNFDTNVINSTKAVAGGIGGLGAVPASTAVAFLTTHELGKAYADIINEFALTELPFDAKLFLVDLDKTPSLAVREGIIHEPTFIIYRNGQKMKTIPAKVHNWKDSLQYLRKVLGYIKANPDVTPNELAVAPITMK